MIRHLLFALAALGLAGCADRPDPVLTGDGPQPTVAPSLAGEIVHRSQSGPPSTVPGECWTHETLPAMIETVTEHVQTAPARLNADGSTASPATFRTVTRQSIVRPRDTVWFRSVCPAVLSPDLVATLQRALAVRGLLNGAPTGVMDAATRTALHRYQAVRGLDSRELSLGAARQLGLATYSLYSLQQPDG